MKVNEEGGNAITRCSTHERGKDVSKNIPLMKSKGSELQRHSCAVDGKTKNRKNRMIRSYI